MSARLLWLVEMLLFNVPAALPATPSPLTLAPSSRRLEAQRREAKAFAKALAGLRAEAGRLNALLADAAGQRSALHQDNMTLEAKLAGELRVRERQEGWRRA